VNSGKAAVAAAAGTLTAVVVDDEKLAREELAYLLGGFPEIEISATAENGLEAMPLIENLEPDIVFLDVQMPGLDGLGLIRKLREKDIPLPYFILATAYDQYAVEAFRLEALDYLLKPIEKDRLTETIERAKKVLFAPLPSANSPVADIPADAAITRSKLLIRSQNRNLIVDARELVFATINDGIITAVASSIEGHVNYKTLEELQSSLDPESFWRAHRSYLVNIHRIREVIPWFNSSFQLRMDDKRQTEIPVSRVQTKRLRTLFKL
jgi:two-component system, LytTR family, response regulator LytT